MDRDHLLDGEALETRLTPGLALRVAGVVTGLWLVIALVLGAQSTLTSALQGDPVPMAAAVRTAMINSLPWIPVTLAVVGLTIRFPVTTSTWKRNLWPHLLALPLLAFAANVLVVLGFWITFDNVQGPVQLARSAAFWATVRIHIALVLYAAIATVTQGVLFYRRARARELSLARVEAQLAKARLQALNAQIRPHFLFNTLHTIGQLWRSGRADEADATLDHLGSLMQRLQSTTSEAEITLDEELGFVEEYLAIEQARFSDRLSTSISASSEARRCYVPPLLLQPLVENALRHGISASSEAGCVRVEAEVRGDRLRVQVTDDGPGMSAPSPSPGSGTGLANTRARLETLFGDGWSLETLEPEDGGTRVVVELPALLDSPAGAGGRTKTSPAGEPVSATLEAGS